MKTFIQILKYANRLFMMVFLILILGMAMDKGMYVYALLVAFFLGTFQVISFLVINSDLPKGKKAKKENRIYFTSVLAYFIFSSIYSSLKSYSFLDFLTYVLQIIPVILSIYFTLIIEKK